MMVSLEVQKTTATHFCPCPSLMCLSFQSLESTSPRGYFFSRHSDNLADYLWLQKTEGNCGKNRRQALTWTSQWRVFVNATTYLGPRWPGCSSRRSPPPRPVKRGFLWKKLNNCVSVKNVCHHFTHWSV